MSAVLTKDSSITCVHPGPGTVKLGAGGKLRVKGKPVLRKQDVGPDITGCQFQLSPPAVAVKCTKVLTLAMESSTKLKVGGAPVMLDTLTGTTNSTTNGAPTPSILKVTANQPKLTAK